MAGNPHNINVFINCPFDSDYFPLLEAMCFCVSYLGFAPRIATERLESGEIRLEKIINLISESRYSIHDLSRCKSKEPGEYFRMNMPFELGMDFGFRRSAGETYKNKKFLIFEENQYELNQSLSDLSGTDIEHHRGDYQELIAKTRNFFKVEAGIDAPGPRKIIGDYATFQEWLLKKKISEGHSEEDAKRIPTTERLDEMRAWIGLGNPTEFVLRDAQ